MRTGTIVIGGGLVVVLLLAAHKASAAATVGHGMKVSIYDLTLAYDRSKDQLLANVHLKVENPTNASANLELLRGKLFIGTQEVAQLEVPAGVYSLQAKATIHIGPFQLRVAPKTVLNVLLELLSGTDFKVVIEGRINGFPFTADKVLAGQNAAGTSAPAILPGEYNPSSPAENAPTFIIQAG